MERNEVTSLKLEIEDLEERIAPSIITLTVGLNSPQGTHTVVGPAAATPGALTAITAIMTQGPGDIANIDFVVVC